MDEFNLMLLLVIMITCLLALGFIAGWIAHRVVVRRWHDKHMIDLPYFRGRPF
ncbi:MAG: hypothetical protein ACR2PR_08120 [Pseudohongiellaceae bacterium]